MSGSTDGADFLLAWVDLSVALTPKSLSLYHRFLQSSYTPLRTSTTAIMRIFVAKGIKEPSEKLEVMKVLNVLSLLDPLESQTRGAPDDAMVTFRAGLGGILAAYGTELIALTEVVSPITGFLCGAHRLGGGH